MRRIPLLAALAVLFVCSCAKEADAPATKTQNPAPEEVMQSVYLPGQINVYFDEALVSLLETGADAPMVRTKAPGLEEAMEELGVVSFERLFPVDEEFEDRHREFGLHRWYRVRFDGGTPSPEAAERFMLLDGVQNARPVNKVKMTVESYFNDPLESRQWHYHNTGSSKRSDINVVPVWKDYTTGSSNVIVSVVDGGIDQTHEDLAAAVVPPGDNGSKNFMRNNTGYRIVAHDHGTHVAGTIGAVNNNGKGVAGIAGGNAQAGVAGVRLMSCQVFQTNPDGTPLGGGANFEAAIVWGADHGAVLSNNSWGHDFTDNNGNYNKDAAEASHNFYLQPNTGAYKDGLKDAIDYFNKYGGMNKSGQQTGPMAGGVVFFAAGNEGRPWGSPAGYPGCVAVGAITNLGARSNFSNYGEWVDICAPGVGVISTTPGSTYSEMSGTSMACPHVTGVAALVVSYCGGEGFTREQLIEKMIGGANSADYPASYRIGPLVDALGAITYGTGEPPEKVTDFTVDKVLSNNVTISLKVPSDRDGKPAYGFRVLAAESQSALQGCNPRSPGSGVLYGDFLSGDAAVGETVTGTVGDLGFNKSYYISVSAFDYGRNFSEITGIKTITTGSNHAPVISTEYAGDYKFHVHDRFQIPFNIVDEDNHVLTVQFDKDENDKGVLSLLESTKSGEYVLQVLGVASPEGKYVATLSASDNYGLSAKVVINYEVLPNQAPVVKKEIDNVILNYAGDMVKLNMEDFVIDPDGEVLNYKIDISDNSVVHLSQNTGSAVLTVTALADAGLATVTLSATDAGGKTVSTSFKVLVRAASQEMQAYPNPVVETLYVGTGQNADSASISIYNAVGAKVYSTTAYCSAFEPAVINMRNAGPGLYTLEVEYGGKVYRSNLIKK
ncbi:MAG: S8 family serine peptidase [Bacteroidales bacterium]|nr:S8 family serine peptidase [Bacteroidales bacterium]